jgi:pimeloyl-ACP methyl ester carboxylesterase
MISQVAVDPFTIDVPDAVLADLDERLARTRWPDEADGGGWAYGTDLETLRELVTYWREAFSWRDAEARLNALPGYRTTIDGDTIHFVHVATGEPGRLALLLTHGWPSTFAEILPLVPRLARRFDLVIPSLPGFGYSSPHTRPGPRQAAERFAVLMERLGYERFGAGGGDIGARVTTQLGRRYPERVVGIHLSSVDLAWPAPLPDDLTAEERDYLERSSRWGREEGAYAEIQATRPQTLAYGLADSPVGLAGWILEKFRAWSDCDGDVWSSFSRDELLTTITLYWVTGTINSANRWYYERRHDPEPELSDGERVEVPTAIMQFPGEEDLRVPRSFAERAYEVVRWTDAPHGGHFAALEEPDLLADDVAAFFGGLPQ